MAKVSPRHSRGVNLEIPLKIGHLAPGLKGHKMGSSTIAQAVFTIVMTTPVVVPVDGNVNLVQLVNRLVPSFDAIGDPRWSLVATRQVLFLK